MKRDLSNMDYYFLGEISLQNKEINTIIKGLELAYSVAETTKEKKDIRLLIDGLKIALEAADEVAPKAQNLFELISIFDIATDEANFQQRKQAYSERSVESILNAIRNNIFNWSEFDPITLWLSPQGKYYVLSGHSRLESFRRAYQEGYTNFEFIPAKIFEGTLNEAKQIAKRSNTLSTKETSVERAAFYRSMIFEEGKTYREVSELAKKQEDKNWKYIINLAYLNPNGSIILMLEELGENDSINNIKKIADYVGEARSKHSALTNSHENELYRYLTKNNRIVKYSKTEFLGEIQKFFNRNQVFSSWTPDMPLNLENLVSKSQVELNYDERVEAARKKLKDAQEAREDKKKELINSIKSRENRSPNNEEIKKIQEILYENGFDAAVKKAEQEMLLLDSQKGQIKDLAKQQMSLFGIGEIYGRKYRVNDQKRVELVFSYKDYSAFTEEEKNELKKLFLYAPSKLLWYSKSEHPNYAVSAFLKKFDFEPLSDDEIKQLSTRKGTGNKFKKFTPKSSNSSSSSASTQKETKEVNTSFASEKLAAKYQKKAESFKAQSDQKNKELKTKSTHTPRMMRQYMSKRTESTMLSEKAKVFFWVAEKLRAGTMPKLVEKMFSVPPDESEVKYFLRYYSSSGYYDAHISSKPYYQDYIVDYKKRNT